MQQPDLLILANTIDPEESRVAVVRGGRLSELFVERMWESVQGGEIYKARVESVMRGMNAAFVTLGDGRNGFLYLGDARGAEVHEGADLLVQVTKTARKNKGPRVTTRISLPGRYLVLIPGGRDIGVSKRIAKEAERARLKQTLRALDLVGFGVILRTASEGVDADVLADDLRHLKSLWAQIQADARRQSSPCLLYKDIGLLGRVLRDELRSQDFSVVVDNREEYDRAEEYLAQWGKKAEDRLSLHRSNIPLFEYYDIEKEIDALLDSKVWLELGAYLIIETTEALTVIDVNTGKYTGGASFRDTVLATNLEAAEEIAWQLRLRAIGGIIIVDFIDMESEDDRKTLLAKLDQVFAADPCRVKVYGISPLGLVSITRKRARAELRSVLTRPCPLCGSSRYVYKDDTLAMKLKRFIRKIAAADRAPALLLSCAPSLAAHAAENYQRAWEEELGRKIYIRAASGIPLTKFHLDKVGTQSGIETLIQQRERRGEKCVVYRTSDT